MIKEKQHFISELNEASEYEYIKLLEEVLFEFDSQAKVSKIEGNHSILKDKDIDAFKEKAKIIKFLSAGYIKFKVAIEYAKLCTKELEHKLSKVIEDIFK